MESVDVSVVWWDEMRIRDVKLLRNFMLRVRFPLDFFWVGKRKIKFFFLVVFLLFLRCGLSCLWFLLFLVYVALRATVC